jgi:phage repressor protein C with HTH and peptisase S24 domain
MGAKIRRQRRRLGLTLDDLAVRSGISKPYLSLIETEKVPNPPSDEKLVRLEQVLGFKTGELVAQAHLHRTPSDVRAMLTQLLAAGGHSDRAEANQATAVLDRPANGEATKNGNGKSKLGVPLDDLYLSGALQQFVDRSAGNVETIPTNVVPVINRVSAGYPKDFTDLSYPKGAADTYLSCPDVSDPDAFAARVHGDSMIPKYRQDDIVIFSPRAAVKNGDDAFVRFNDGQTTFKRVFFEQNETDQSVIRLQPRNEKYPPRITLAEEITGLWRAVFKYQSVEE